MTWFSPNFKERCIQLLANYSYLAYLMFIFLNLLTNLSNSTLISVRLQQLNRLLVSGLFFLQISTLRNTSVIRVNRQAVTMVTKTGQGNTNSQLQLHINCVGIGPNTERLRSGSVTEKRGCVKLWFSDSSLLNVNIFWFLSSSMTVNWIFLDLWTEQDT